MAKTMPNFPNSVLPCIVMLAGEFRDLVSVIAHCKCIVHLMKGTNKSAWDGELRNVYSCSPLGLSHVDLALN